MPERHALPWRKLWDFISACSQQGDLQAMFRCAVQEIPRLISCEQSVIAIADMITEGKTRVSLVCNGVPDAAVRPYCDYYFYKDEARLGLGPESEFYQADWTDRARARSEFARDFIQGLMKIDMSAGIPIYDPGGRGGICLIVARAGRVHLNAREESILLAIRPHFLNLYALHKRLETIAPENYCAAELAGGCGLLSRREAEIASLLCRRLTTAEIATMLQISRRTVETHVEHIYVKLNIRSRRELITAILGNVADPRGPSARNPFPAY